MPLWTARPRPSKLVWQLGVAIALVTAFAAVAGAAYNNFESGHVRPLALSPDGTRLFAVNTPDNRLDIFDVDVSGLTRVASVTVGMEPVAVAARSNTEVWVVNHLSDSVSIVTINTSDPTLSRVTRTLLVGDEPRDIVFAGTAGNRAFITTARRGQVLPLTTPAAPLPAMSLTTAGTPRALVWTFDANSLGAALGGTPLSVVELLTDTPRALAVSTNGATVYAAGFHSGNRTTSLLETVVTPGGGVPPFPPGSTPGAPNTGLIVRFNGTQWVDEINRNWSSSVPFTLPDRDVFLINANANPPALAAGTNFVTGVGTVLFNMAVKPDTGAIYVSNLASRNFERFESLFENPPSSGIFRGVRGHTAESHITVISGTTPTPHHLNSHVNYNVPTGPPSEIAQSIAFPLGMVFSPSSSELFVTSFGTGDLAVFDTADLEDGDASTTNTQIHVGAGPSGVALDVANDRLYVMNRLDQQIAIIQNATNPGTRALWKKVNVSYDAEPAAVTSGRQFLYDAATTSGHGDGACASCHIFGDLDSLAWDLGDPFGDVLNNPNPFALTVGPVGDFHPLKGPMTTQSLRGMAGQGPMHWRGDRTGGNDPGGNALDEDAAFKKFNGAFVNLLGRPAQLTAPKMQAFADFALTLEYPPNPIRALNNVATAAQGAGATFFSNNAVDGGALTCVNCHALPTGAGGNSSFEGEPQEFKIAHMRNLYAKIGMFPVAGNQVRGFGFLHDGAVPTVFTFLTAPVFSFAGGGTGNTQRANVEQFSLALDTGLRPIVGQQVSATPTTFSDATVINRIQLMIDQDNAGACELVAKGVSAGIARGYLFVGSNNFQPDRASDALITATNLRGLAAAAGQELTYTCVPPGAGTRVALDRDEDGRFDRDELDAGFDPGDPGDPAVCEDGLDNDGDTLVDAGDPGCKDANWVTESPACNDGLDNDFDSQTDLADADCPNAWSDNEFTAAPSCGLLGVEALPLLAWAALRRRRQAGGAVQARS